MSLILNALDAILIVRPPIDAGGNGDIRGGEMLGSVGVNLGSVWRKDETHASALDFLEGKIRKLVVTELVALKTLVETGVVLLDDASALKEVRDAQAFLLDGVGLLVLGLEGAPFGTDRTLYEARGNLRLYGRARKAAQTTKAFMAIADVKVR